MRRLRDLWETSPGDSRRLEVIDGERGFVRQLLTSLSNGNTVRGETWRRAEDLWERTVKDQIDLGKPHPEAVAMFVLTVATTAGVHAEQAVAQIRKAYDSGS